MAPVSLIDLSPEQYAQTVAGNVYLRALYHIGRHASQFGVRPADFYLELAASVRSLCLSHTAAFGQTPDYFGQDVPHNELTESLLLAIAENDSTTRMRIRDDLNGYLGEAAAFWQLSRRLAVYRKTCAELPREEAIGLVIDGAENDYVSRVDPDSLHVKEERLSLVARERYFKESGTKLALETLTEHPNIRSMINIGARIDPTSYFLARKFADRKFMSFDFQHNLREQNQTAFTTLPENMFFGSGYGLDALRAGLRADSVFLMATSVLFTVQEAEQYFKYFAQNGIGTVIINESWATPIEGYDCGLVVRPEDVPVCEPFLGGTVLNAHHNYLHHLEQAGYTIVSSRIIDDHFGSWYNIAQIVARL